MPNKERYSKEFIINKTIEYIEKYGFETMNARSLSKFINISTQPLFRNFENMEDLKIQTYAEIKRRYLEYVHINTKEEDYLFSISYYLILYAKINPNLFKTLFYSDLYKKRSVKELMMSEHNSNTIKRISKLYKINIQKSEEICRDIRFFSHGIANQVADKIIIIENEELEKIIKNMINKLLN